MARKQNSENMSGNSGAAPTRYKPAPPKRAARTVSPAFEPEGAAAAAPAPGGQPSREAIARLAYSYWEARGYQGGSPEEDWTRAERELAIV
jgi:Protein of unknown function (DUF2934)